MFAKKLLKEILMADKSYHELIDEEWKIVEKTLPPEKKTGRPQIEARAAFNGILWIQNVENFLPLIRLFAKCIGTAWGLVKMPPDMRQSKILNPLAAVKLPKFMSLSTKIFKLLTSCFPPVM